MSYPDSEETITIKLDGKDRSRMFQLIDHIEKAYKIIEISKWNPSHKGGFHVFVTIREEKIGE